jgi:hypothetical protein
MSRRVLPLLLLVAFACHPSRQARPTPPPPFAGKPIDSVSTSDVIAYANTLQFDSTAPAADTLTVVTPMGDTIHLEAAPEIGAAALSDTGIASGRIIARMHSTAAFTPLGAGAGTTYFWVNGSGDRARGVMIPADTQYRRFNRPLIERDHLPPTGPTVRFITLTSGGIRIFLVNGRCGGFCCSFSSDFVASDMSQVDSAIQDMHKRMSGAQ